MGELRYGNAPPVVVDDRTLFHLQVVIGAKLRRRESFYLTLGSPEEGFARATLWLDPSIPVVFVYEQNESIQLNRQWLEVLSNSSNSQHGLQLMAEDCEQVRRFRAPAMTG